MKIKKTESWITRCPEAVLYIIIGIGGFSMGVLLAFLSQLIKL